MIPKIIHYCWFGGNPLPELAVKCIESWKKFCPDYEIKEWNETNFDLDCCDYVKEAYSAKKWAFVSDYARFWILYHEGGLYFDTDVEIIKPIDEIVKRGSFMGCETIGQCNPGLGLAAEAGLELYREILEFYKKKHFFNKDGIADTTTIVIYVTNILKNHGWAGEEKIQKIEEILIYPQEYFCPMDYETGKVVITQNTYTVHHYTASWHSKTEDRIINISRFCNNYFGKYFGKKVARFIDFPFRIKNKIEQLGFFGMLKFALNKIICK